MDDDNGTHGMTMRTRRTSAALRDVSNEQSTVTDDDAGAVGKKRKRTPASSSSSDAAPPSASASSFVIVRVLPLSCKSADPAHCSDVLDRMYNIYYAQEEVHRAKPYLQRQNDINGKMRSILVDWLVSVATQFNLQSQTLWLCVNILDRYLERVQCTRSKLQLVGVVALLIACKHEEIYPPEVKDYVCITDYAYDRAEILALETTILVQLNYHISVPTGYHFLTRYLNAIRASQRTRHLAAYYAERNLQEADMLHVRPHTFAAAALYAALKQQNAQFPELHRAPIWTQVLQDETGLDARELLACARTIVRHVGEQPVTASKRRLNAAKNKYSTDAYLGIADLPLPVI